MTLLNDDFGELVELFVAFYVEVAVHFELLERLLLPVPLNKGQLLED